MTNPESKVNSPRTASSDELNALMEAAVQSNHPGLILGNRPQATVLFLMRSGSILPFGLPPGELLDSESILYQAKQFIHSKPDEILAAATSEIVRESDLRALEISLHVKGHPLTVRRVRLPLVERRFPVRRLKVKKQVVVLTSKASLFAIVHEKRHPSESQVAPVVAPKVEVRSDSERLELAIRLRELGLWRDLSDDIVQANVDAVAAGGHPWSTEMAETVQFMADGEELAEGGVEEFLEQVAPVMATHGVTLEFETRCDSPEEGYVIDINGVPVEMWGPNAWENDSTWTTATVRPLERLNALLHEVGSELRFHSLYTGANDGIAMLIDPEIVRLLDDHRLLSKGERPELASSSAV